jgi:hypothetical protein
VADDVLGKLTVSALEGRVLVEESWRTKDARGKVARCALRWAAGELDPDEALALVGELIDANEPDEVASDDGGEEVEALAEPVR